MCHVQAKCRAGWGCCAVQMNHAWEEGWEGLMVVVAQEQGWGSPAPPGAWHIILSPSHLREGAPSHTSPPSGASAHQGCSSCAILAAWGAFHKGRCWVWAAGPMGRAETQPSLLLVVVFV